MFIVFIVRRLQNKFSPIGAGQKNTEYLKETR